MPVKDYAPQKLAQLAQIAKEYEPRAQELYTTMVTKFRAADRRVKLALAVFVLWGLYFFLTSGGKSYITMHLEFSTPEELESLLARLQTSRRPTRIYLQSAKAHLEVIDPLRFTEQHSLKEFIFRHGAHNDPVTLSCAGADSAITIRSPDVHISNLIIKSCTRSAIFVQLPPRYSPSSMGNTTTLSNITLLSNYGDKGGAIHVARGFLILSGVNVTDNYAPNGGAIYLARGKTGLRVTPPSDQLHGVRNVFKANSAQLGGALYVDSALLGVDLTRVSFLENIAYQAGGAIYSTQAAAVDSTLVTLDACNFTGNQAAQVGGALAAEGNHDVFVSATSLSDNAAGLRGGALWLHASYFGSFSMSSSSLTSNAAGSASAAALTAAGSSPFGSGPSSKKSKPSAASPSPSGKRRGGGGASSSTKPSRLRANANITDSTPPPSGPLSDTKSSLGGAIYISGNIRASIADKSQFVYNSATSSGGALTCIECASVKIAETLFDGNTAASGGAAYFQLLKGPAALIRSRFANNVADWAAAAASHTKNATAARSAAAKAGVCGRGGGGAVCIEAVQGASIKVSGSTFVHNSGYAGGALYINLDACSRSNETCPTDVVATEFTGNAAHFSGGALYLTDMAGVNLHCHPRHISATYEPASSTLTTPTTTLTSPTTSKSSKYRPSKRTKSGRQSATAPAPAAATPLPAAPTPTPTSTSSPAPILCSGQLRDSQSLSVGPAARGQCSNSFSNNTVSSGYGPHVATRVYCLEPQLMLGRSSLSSSVSASGHLRVANEQTFSYNVIPFDFFLQHVNVTLPDVSIASAAEKTEKRATLRVSSPLASIVAGSARLPNVSVTGQIGTHSISLQARLGGRVLASTPLVIDVRTCEVGEVAAGRTCKTCDDPARGRTYSFDPLRTKCERCPWHAVCRGWSIVPTAGYWHAHPRSARIHACASPDACIYPGRAAALSQIHDALQPHSFVPAANVTSYAGALCAPGYQGPLCGSCAKGYGRMGVACQKCGGRLSAAGLLLLWKVIEAAVIAGLVALRIFSGHEFSRQAKRREQDPQAAERAAAPALEDLVPRGQDGWVTLQSLKTIRLAALKDTALAVLRDSGHSVSTVAEALILFHQLLSLLSTLPVPLPAPLASLATLLSPRAPLDCLLAPASPHKATARILLTATTPLLVLALLLAAWTLFLRNRGIPTAQLRPLLTEAALLTSVQFATFYYPHLVSSLLSTFSCHSLFSATTLLTSLFSRAAPLAPVPSPPLLGYWTQDYTQACFSRSHLSFSLTIALPLLLLIAALPPALLFSFISHHTSHNNLHTPKLITRFGYLFTDYSPASSQGHALKFLSLLTLSFLLQGPTRYLGTFLQLLLFAAACGCGAYWLVTRKPFAWKPMNSLYAAPLAAAAITALTQSLLMGIPTSGFVGLVVSVLWLPAVLVNLAVGGILTGLVGAVVKPLLPKDRVTEAAMKLQGVLGHGRAQKGKEVKEGKEQ